MLNPFTGSMLSLTLAGSLWLAASCSPRAPAASTGAAPAPAESTSAPVDSTLASATASKGSAAPAPAEQPAASAAPDSAGTGPAASPAPTADSGFVQYDPATKTVTFRLVAGAFDFDGFTNGGATLPVPPGSTNVWNFEQNDGTPHSAEIAAGTGPLPNSGGNPAIPRAYTNKVVEGLVQGATDVIKFTAPDTGSYRIICGVPGHALSGMWLWFKIDPAAKAPTFGATPK
jgi:plastocyanin